MKLQGRSLYCGQSKTLYGKINFHTHIYLQDHVELGKPLLPDAFKERNHIEDIKGVYVPFWLYDGTADVDMAFRGTISHSHREGDYTVTVTENYSILRQGTVQFNRVPADGSSKMPDEFMDAIEPYNYNEMIPFEMGYMTGYLEDRYDVTAE